MENMTAGVGFAVLGFWIFLAAIVAASLWDVVRKRDAQHETLRRIIESGQKIDGALTQQLVDVLGGNKDSLRDLRTAAFIMLSIAPGMLLLGGGLWFVAGIEIVFVLAGVAGLMLCLGTGMLWAVRKMQIYDEAQGLR